MIDNIALLCIYSDERRGSWKNGAASRLADRFAHGHITYDDNRTAQARTIVIINETNVPPLTTPLRRRDR